MNILQISPDIKLLIYYKRISLLPFLNRLFFFSKKKKKEKNKDDRKIFFTSLSKHWFFLFVEKFIAKELQLDLLIEIFLLTWFAKLYTKLMNLLRFSGSGEKGSFGNVLKIGRQAVSKYFETFRCFTKFSFHHKWNDGRLLLKNMACRSCLTSCQTTKIYDFRKDLRKLENIRKVPKSDRMKAQCPVPLPKWKLCQYQQKTLEK